jgi:hypothetical protein
MTRLLLSPVALLLIVGHSYQMVFGWSAGGYSLPYWDGNTGRAIYGGQSFSTGSATTGIGINAAGGSQAHNNLQFVCLNTIAARMLHRFLILTVACAMFVGNVLLGPTQQYSILSRHETRQYGCTERCSRA